MKSAVFNLAIAMSLAIASTTHIADVYADTTVSGPYEVKFDGLSGFNLYSPEIVKESYYSTSQYPHKIYNTRMYFSGELHPGAILDAIYVAFTNDNFGINFERPQKLFDANFLNGAPNASPYGYRHVGDPSVTKHTNPVDHSVMYTMFFTAQRRVSPAQESKGGEAVWMHHNQEVWSAVSVDGINWILPQVLLQNTNVNINDPLDISNSHGPAEPSAVVKDTPTAGYVYDVYYEDRLRADKVQVVHVNGNRQATFVTDAYNDPHQHYLTVNPDVQKHGSTYTLLFNDYAQGNADILKVTASSYAGFTGAPEYLINSHDASCPQPSPTGNPNTQQGAYTPHMEWLNIGNMYRLYYSINKCQWTGQRIYVRTMQD